MQVKEPLPKSLPNTGCWKLAFVYFSRAAAVGRNLAPASVCSQRLTRQNRSSSALNMSLRHSFPGLVEHIGGFVLVIAIA
jgi:hypothetical protein